MQRGRHSWRQISLSSTVPIRTSRKSPLPSKLHFWSWTTTAEGGYARWLERVAGADPLQHLRSGPASDRFFIGFTSGTTSVPKAFQRSRHSWFESLAAGGKLFRTAEHTHTIAPGPLAHGLALYALMESLDSGGTFVSSSRFSATTLRRQILETQGTTRLVVVPTMLASLVDAAGGQTISTVRSIVIAGSKLDIALQQKTRTIFPNATFFETTAPLN